MRLSIPSGLPVEDVVRYGIQIAAALDHAHRRGIVHCDLKPANVVITETGAKVLDFGIARRGRQLEAEALTRSLEDGRSFSGTPAYMAPEQVRMQPTDERSDVWALGVLLYQAASGRLPFQAATLHDLTSAVLRDPPGPLPAHLPAGLRAVVERCLRKDRRAALPARQRGAGRAGGGRSRHGHCFQGHNGGACRRGPDRRRHSKRRPGRRSVRKAAAPGVGSIESRAARRSVASIVAWKQKTAAQARPPATRTIAILPLRALNQQAADDFLGLGIADAVITKASQLPGLTVRPISAVRAFDKGDVDALEAARRLQVDVVLDGSVQHAGERVKVSVNLLDAHDGSSIWADSFETSAADIFAVQEDIARAVATRLQVRTWSVRAGRDCPALHVERGRIQRLHQRDVPPRQPRVGRTAPARVGYRDRALPRGAPPRSCLCARPRAARVRPHVDGDLHRGQPELIAEASRELAAAGRQDPNLADIHQGRALILWSKYERWRTEAAIRELREAQRLDSSVGQRRSLRALFPLRPGRSRGEVRPPVPDPQPGLRVLQGGALRVLPRHNPGRKGRRRAEGVLEPAAGGLPLPAQAHASRGGTARAQGRAGRRRGELHADHPGAARRRGGKGPAAEATIRRMLEIVPRNRTYHHAAYNAAQVFSLTGKTREAVSLLKEARDNGLFSYTMLARDRLLDPIRSDPEFASLLAEAKVEWERLKGEFEGEVRENAVTCVEKRDTETRRYTGRA